MKVLVPRYSGFCPGVKNAEEKIKLARKSHKSIQILGDLIHNNIYLDYLKQLEIFTVQDETMLKQETPLVIRTHGIPLSSEKKLADNYQLIDLTCFTVKKLQLKIRELSDNGYFIVITGKRNHPEVLGLVSYARDSFVIESSETIEDDLKKVAALLAEKQTRKVMILSQTTSEEELFLRTAELLAENLKGSYIIETLNTICPITALREKEALKLQQSVDFTIVVGDKKSSNANKIYKLLKQNNGNTWFVNDLKHLLSLDLSFKPEQTVQVVSSSSTPDFVEQEIIRHLEKI